VICAPACETALSPDRASLRAVMESQSKLQARLRQQMIELLLELAPNEGYNLSPLPDIRFLRSNRPLTRTPVLYEPGIVIVCQGRKRGYLKLTRENGRLFF
jgi:AraC-type transcriptional regulator N-terminus